MKRKMTAFILAALMVAQIPLSSPLTIMAAAPDSSGTVIDADGIALSDGDLIADDEYTDDTLTDVGDPFVTGDEFDGGSEDDLLFIEEDDQEEEITYDDAEVQGLSDDDEVTNPDGTPGDGNTVPSYGDPTDPVIRVDVYDPDSEYEMVEDISDQTFLTWDAAVDYIEGIDDENYIYQITLLDDVITDTLTMPSTDYRKLVIASDEESENPYVLSHGGSVTITGFTQFEDIILNPDDQNASINVNGKSLNLKNTDACYATMIGTDSSNVEFINDTMGENSRTIWVPDSINVPFVRFMREEETAPDPDTCPYTFSAVNITATYLTVGYFFVKADNTQEFVPTKLQVTGNVIINSGGLSVIDDSTVEIGQNLTTTASYISAGNRTQFDVAGTLKVNTPVNGDGQWHVSNEKRYLTYTLANYGCMTIGTLDMKKGTVYNTGFRSAPDADPGIITVNDAVNLDKLENGGIFAVTNSLNMAASGAIGMSAASKLRLNGNATLYNLHVGETIDGMISQYSGDMEAFTGVDPVLVVSEGSNIAINGSIHAASGDIIASDNSSRHLDYHLVVKKVDATDNPASVKGLICTTNIKAFDLDALIIDQPESVEEGKYTLTQNGTNVMAVTGWIALYASTKEDPDRNDDSDWTELQTFEKWSDAVNYVNTISNPSVHYKLVLSEDVTTCENITLPAKAAGFVLMGTDPENPVTIKYLGNIALTTNTVFENLILVPQSYNTKTGIYSSNDASTINLNGKRFEWVNTYSVNPFATVTGSGASTFILDGWDDDEHWAYLNSNDEFMMLTVNNAFTVSNLTMDHYDLWSVNNAVTVSDQAYLTSATIESKTNMSFKDLHTLDPHNALIYGEAANNSLKISGVVDSIDPAGTETGETNESVKVADKDENQVATTSINKNAIDIMVKYIEASSTDDPKGAYAADAYVNKALAVSAKGAAQYFVIGRDLQYIRFATQKSGNNIVVVPLSELGGFAVELYKKATPAILLGSFKTLQEALTEIDRYADANVEYEILIDPDKTLPASNVKEGVTYDGTNLTIPKKAKKITIASSGIQPCTLYMNNQLTLNTDLELNNLDLADKTDAKGNTVPLKVNLGGYELTLDCITVSDSRLGAVTGNNVNGTSALILTDMDQGIRVNGNIDKVGSIKIDDPLVGSELQSISLESTGNINVGNIENTKATLIGTATVKTGAVDAINSNITVSGTVTNNNDTKLAVILKDSKTGAVLNPDDYGTALTAANTPFHIVKGANISADSITYNGVDNETYNPETNPPALHLIKNAGFVCLTKAKTCYTLYRDSISGNPDPEKKIADFILFSDAVNEINSRNEKTYYLITTTGNESNAAEPFVMPKAGTYKSLWVRGLLEDEPIVDGNLVRIPTTKLFYGNAKNGQVSGAISKLTLTGNTTFSNLVFIDAEQASKGYPARNPLGITIPANSKLFIIDAVYFAGRGLAVNGSKTGSLEIWDMTTATLNAFEGAYDETALKKNIANHTSRIAGSFTNLERLIVPEKSKLILERATSSFDKDGHTTKYSPAVLSADFMDLDSNEIMVGCSDPDKADASVTISGLDITDGDNALVSQGNLTIGNVGYDAEGESFIESLRALNIKNSLEINDDGLTLIGRQQSAKAGTDFDKVGSYINVGGTVTGDYKATVTIVPYNSRYTVLDEVMIINPTVSVGEGDKLQMMTCAKGDIDHFVSGNTIQGSNPAKNAKVIKLGNVFYAAGDEAITVAVAKAESYTDIVTLDDSYKLYTKRQQFDEYGDPVLDDHDEPVFDEVELEAFGFYPTLADAVTAINSANDKNQNYVMILLADVGEVDNPVKATFPAAGKSAGVGIVANAGADEPVIYYSADLSLNTPLSLSNVLLAPTKKGAGAPLNLKLNNYALNLSYSEATADLYNDVIYDGRYAVGDAVDNWISEDGATLASIGNITSGKSGELILDGTALSLSGNLDVAALTMDSSERNAVMSVTASGKKASIGNIYNTGISELVAKRGLLTISGEVYNAGGDDYVDELSITIDNSEDAESCLVAVGSSTIKNNNYSSLFGAKTKLFTGARVSGRDRDDTVLEGLVDVNVTVTDGIDAYNLVKVGNDFYYVDEEIKGNMVTMSRYFSSATVDPDTKVPVDDEYLVDSSQYVDVCAALAQIGNWSDPDSMYVIELEGNVEDVNIRDNNLHSALTMPANNKAGAIIFNGPGLSYGLKFSGAITAYAGFTDEADGAYNGGLVFNNITLEPVATGADTAAKSNITLNRNGNDKSGSPELRLNNTMVGSLGGYIGNIAGTAGITDVYVNAGQVIAGNVSNIRTFDVNACQVVVQGNVSNVKNLYLDKTDGNVPGFAALGTATLDSLTVNENTKVVLSTKVNGAKNNTTIKGDVIVMPDPVTGEITNDPVILIQAVNPNAKNPEAMATGVGEVETYKGANLVNAPVADARFFTLDVNLAPGEDFDPDFAPYKMNKAVMNGDFADMHVELIRAADEASGITSYDSYTKTYADAVAAIGAMAIPGDYTIKFINHGTGVQNVLTAGKNGAEAFGAMAFPAYKVARSLFVTSNEGEAHPDSTNENPLKYGPTIVRFSGNLTPQTHVTFDNIVLQKWKNQTTEITNSANKYVIGAALTTGYDLSFGPHAGTETGYDNRELNFDAATGTKGVLTVTDHELITFCDNVNLLNLALMHGVTVDGFGEETIINKQVPYVAKQTDPKKKMGIGVLLSNDCASIRIEGTAGDLKGINPKSDNAPILTISKTDKEGHVLADTVPAGVCTWDEMVSYINAIGNKNAYYLITLLSDVGTANAPIAKLTMPSAAAVITIKDNKADGDHIVNFVGTSVSLSTNVVLDDIGIHAYSKAKDGSYSPASYSISIPAASKLTLIGDGYGEGTGTAADYSKIAQISGGELRLVSTDSESEARLKVVVDKNVTVKKLIIEDSELDTLGGNVTSQTGTELVGADMRVQGLASLKDTMMDDADIKAQNITLTGTTTAAQSVIDAGLSYTVGTGKVTIANLKVAVYDDFETDEDDNVTTAVRYADTCEIITKQDKNGNAQLTISGQVIPVISLEDVTPVSSLEDDEYSTPGTLANIRVLYNNQSTLSKDSKTNKYGNSDVIARPGMLYATFANNVRADEYCEYFKGIYAKRFDSTEKKYVDEEPVALRNVNKQLVF